MYHPSFFQFLLDLDIMSRHIILNDRDLTLLLLSEVRSNPTKTKAPDNGVTLELVYIPGGTFMMGSPEGDGDVDEEPQHQVTVPDFSMGKYPVTQAQWREVAALPEVKRSLDAYPSYFKGDNHPVENVSWNDAVEFCARLSAHTNREYRLPTEAEWEYACRAGTETPFYFGETITEQQTNFNGNVGKTSPVGKHPPNAYSIYDMHGNVWEWCQDFSHYNYENAPTDGSAWEVGSSSFHVVRGGSWYDNPRNCRSAYRYFISPGNRTYDVGFRVVCSAP